MYNWILIMRSTGEVIGPKSLSEKEPPCGEPDKLEWIEWGKELPDDIHDGGYKLVDGELLKE